jgi:hypothetical protein
LHRAFLLKNAKYSDKVNQDYMKKLSSLNDAEKCRLVYEYFTMLKFKKEWCAIISAPIRNLNPKVSFDAFLSSFIRQYDELYDQNKVDMDQIKSWDSVKFFLVEKK